MEKKSRYELIKTIESQKEQLTRFETRLRGKEFIVEVIHVIRHILTTIIVYCIAYYLNHCY